MLRSPQNLPARIAAVQERVARAAGAAGRSAQSVTLLAIGKAQPVPLLGAAAACGLEHFGESYLQEALGKIAALRERGLTWHFVGRVQANKTRPIAEEFAWVHALDERSEEHTSELQSPYDLVCRLLLEKQEKYRISFP